MMKTRRNLGNNYYPYLRRLQLSTLVAIDVNRILAGEMSSLLVKQTVRAELLLGDSVQALDVGIALSSYGIGTIAVGAGGRALLGKLIRRLLLLLVLLCGLGSKLVLVEL